MESKPPKETEVVVVPPTEKKDEVVVVAAPVTPEPVVPPVVVPPAPPAEDFRTKFGMSTRENQVLQGELEELDKQLGEITREEIPTDEEMVREYPEYEFAEPLMQSVLKRQAVSDRRQKGIQLNVSRFLGSVRKRNELAAVVSTNAALKGREEKFIDFASDPKRVNVPVETLVSAFLFEVKDEIVAPVVVPAPAPVEVPPTPPAVPKKDDEVPPASPLERGSPSGGDRPQPPAKKERTVEELQALRTSNPKEYNELVRRGEI